MDEKLKKIIEESTFEVIPGRFVYAKVAKAPLVDNHFFISKDKNEITVVTKEDNLDELEIIEKNKDVWSLIALYVSAPFYSPGFLAAVSGAMAKEKIDVLIVSTYSVDYIMVIEKNLEIAKKALMDLGFKVK